MIPGHPKNLQNFDVLPNTPFNVNPNLGRIYESPGTPTLYFRGRTPIKQTQTSPAAQQNQPSPIAGPNPTNLDMSLQERQTGFHSSTPLDFNNPVGSIPIFDLPTNTKCIQNPQGAFALLKEGIFKVTDGVSENSPTPQQILHAEHQAATRNLFQEETLNTAMNLGPQTKLSTKKIPEQQNNGEPEKMRTRSQDRETANVNYMSNYSRSQSKSPNRSNQQNQTGQQNSSNRESRPRDRQQSNSSQQQQQRGHISNGRYYRSNSGNFYRSNSQNQRNSSQSNSYPQQRSSSQNGYNNRSNSQNKSNYNGQQNQQQYRSTSQNNQQNYQQRKYQNNKIMENQKK